MSEQTPILLDILIGLGLDVEMIKDHDDIEKPGFYIFFDSPATLSYWQEDSPMIDQLPNKHGMMLHGFIDYERNLTEDCEAILIHAEIWKNEIEKTRERFNHDDNITQTV